MLSLKPFLLIFLQIPYFDVPFKLVVIVIAYGLSIVNGVIALYIIFTSGVGKNGSTVAVRVPHL